MPLDSLRDRFPSEPKVDLGGKSARQYMDSYDTRSIGYGSPYDEKDLSKVSQGTMDAYMSSVMELPMVAMQYLMPDDPYDPNVLQSGPKDRMREAEFKWQEHMEGQAQDPSYATGQDFGAALGVIADPFIDLPLAGVPALGKLMKLSPDKAARTTGGVMGQLLDETGAIKAQRGGSKVTDVYGEQIESNGQWFHAERVFGRPASEFKVGDNVNLRDGSQTLETGEVLRTVNSDLVRESGANISHTPETIDKYATAMNEEYGGNWGEFPPITGVIHTVTKEDVKLYSELTNPQELAFSRPITDADIGRKYVQIENGHNRAYAANKLGIDIQVIDPSEHINR